MAITGMDTTGYNNYYQNTSQASSARLEKTLDNVNSGTTDEQLMVSL